MNWFLLIMGIILKLFVWYINCLKRICYYFIRIWRIKKIERENEEERGVENSVNLTISQVLGEGVDINPFFVSGGSLDLRNDILTEQIKKANRNQIPCIILHESNKKLENQISQLNLSNITVVNDTSCNYDPILGINEKDLVQLLMEAFPKELNMKFDVCSYIAGMVSYLREKRTSPSISLFCSCPHSQLYDKIDGLIINGKISNQKGQEIKAKLLNGQSEVNKLKYYFNRLKQEGNKIFFNGSKSHTNIVNAIKNRNIIMIDISLISNTYLLHLILAEMKNALKIWNNIMVVMDEINICSNEDLQRFVIDNSSRCTFGILSSDVFAMCNGNTSIFATISGMVNNFVISQHSSENSSNIFSSLLGEYDKKEISFTYGKDSSGIIQSTYNIAVKREYRVKPEEINSMNKREVFLKNGRERTIRHGSL